MSTCNFKHQPFFPMYVVDDGFFNVGDDADSRYEFDEFLYREIEKTVEDFSSDLKFFSISLKSGYYAGAQVYIEDIHGFNWGAGWDDEDCRYWFDECRTEVIKAYNSEISKIKRWLRNDIANAGFREIRKIAQFGNGEAIYGYVD